jgi:carboxypeptidase T
MHAKVLGCSKCFILCCTCSKITKPTCEVKNLVDNYELYFVPAVNPDGYKYNEQISPNGGGMWRKNRRNNGGSFGVDINRNFGYMWGIDNNGSSPNPSF